jgi:hypothetical protein
MEIQFTAGWMLAGLLVSTVGFGLFTYGRKQTRVPQLLAGIVMMVYPGFIASPAVILAIGAGLVGGVWVSVRAGA